MDAHTKYIGQVFKKGDSTLYANIVNFSVNSAKVEDCYITLFNMPEGYDRGLKMILPKGITLNQSSYDDIIAAYGQPTDEYSGDLYDKNVLFTRLWSRSSSICLQR